MSNPTNANPGFPEAATQLYDDSGNQIVVARAKNVGTSAGGTVYGDIGVTVEIEPVANQEVNTKAGDIAAGSAVAGAFVDGAIATLGTEGDSAITNPASSGTLLAFTKGLLTNLALGQKTKANSLPVTLASDQGTNAAPISTSQTLGGSALSATNPEPNISNIQQFILNAASFSCSTGLVSAAASQAASFFVSNTSTKSVLIWSIRIMYSNASQITDVRSLTADDTNISGGTADIGNAINLKSGGGTIGSTAVMHHAAGVTAPGVSASSEPLDEVLNQVNATTEVLSPGMFLYIPAGTAGGVALYTGTTAAGKWTVTLRWSEF